MVDEESRHFTYWKQISTQNTILWLIIMKHLKIPQNTSCSEEDRSEKTQILQET